MLVFISLTAAAQPQLIFRFANPVFTNGNFMFDVELRADVPGTYLRDLQLYINYNTAAFGSNIAPDISVISLDLIFPAFYKVVAIANNTDSKIAIITESLFELTQIGSSGLFVDIPTEFTPICKVIMPVVDASKAAGISFDQVMMNGGQYAQSYYSALPAAYYNPNMYYNNWSNLSIPGQDIMLEAGWSGISGYLAPADDNIVQMFNQVVSDMVMLNDLTNIYYPAQNINTLANWDYTSGYLLKMNNNHELKMNGSLLDSKDLDISQGWSLMPVLSDCEADVVELFSGYPTTFIKEVAGWKVYWPEYGINTLNYLEPGKAYFAKMEGQALITFPECSPLKGAELTGSVDRQHESAYDISVSSLMTKFNITRTASTHTIALPASAIEINGNFTIMAFDENDNLYGMASWNGESTSLTVFGDDPLTEEKDGFQENDLIIFRALNQETKEEADLIATWDRSLAQHEGLFITNGLSAISELKLSTSDIAENDAGRVLIYPNPTTEKVNIQVPQAGSVTISVFDISGQLMLNEIFSGRKATINMAAFDAGIYIIEVKGDNLLKTDRLIKK